MNGMKALVLKFGPVAVAGAAVAPFAGTAAAAGVGLTEIIVTAQRREVRSARR